MPLSPKKKVYLKKNNVDVELVLKRDVIESKAMYEDSEVDGFFDVFTDIIMLNAKDIPAKVVYISDYSETADVIIAKPEFKSLAELKGRVVSFEGINTFSHFFVLSSLGKAGLTEFDCRFKNIPAQDVLKALEQGAIDAGHTWDPFKSQALEKGYKILATAGETPGLIVDVLAFSPEIIKQRTDEIRAIVKSLFEALDYIKDNPDEALKIMADKESMTVQEMQAGIKGVYQFDLKSNIQAMALRTGILYRSGWLSIDFYLKRGQLLSIPEMDEIIEARFINELAG